VKILFIYSGLPKGGIETFFLRMSKQLFNEGYEVRFLFFGDFFDLELLTELQKFATIFKINDYLNVPDFFKKKSPLLKILMPLKKQKLQQDILKDITHIHAPDYNSILYTNRIVDKSINANISTGIYHINEFNFLGSKKWYFGRKVEELMHNLPSQNILFFNEISKEFYNNKFNNKFNNSIVTPIGIEFKNDNSGFLATQNNQIVSVGRLTNWKKYNFHMIEVIKSLKDKNMIFYYDSYGDGYLRDVLNKKVKDYQLQDLIKFHGTIPYSKFKETVSNKIMFIGAGTAIIEASAYGIPSLIGIENEDEPMSYGFLHDTNTFSYQEKQLNYKKEKIEDYILFLKEMNKESYEKECLKAKLRAKDFSIEQTKKDFISMINSSNSLKFYLNYFQLVRILFSMFFNKVCFPKSNYSKRL